MFFVGFFLVGGVIVLIFVDYFGESYLVWYYYFSIVESYFCVIYLWFRGYYVIEKNNWLLGIFGYLKCVFVSVCIVSMFIEMCFIDGFMLFKEINCCRWCVYKLCDFMGECKCLKWFFVIYNCFVVWNGDYVNICFKVNF